MYSTFCIEEYDGRIRNTLTVKFQRSLSPSSRLYDKINAKKNSNLSSKEIKMKFEKTLKQKIQENIDAIKLKISVKTDELINKILLRKNLLINEANNIQQKLNENMISYLNENFVENNESLIRANELNETRNVANFSQNAFDKINPLVELEYDNKNEFNIGRIVNLNFPLSDLERAKHFVQLNQYKEAMKLLGNQLV